MSYEYEWDRTDSGNRVFPKKTYSLIQEGLKHLRLQVSDWNEKVKALGAKPPYEVELEDLDVMINYGESELQGTAPWISLRGVSVGSMRYLRAGLELSLILKRSQIKQFVHEGWPSAAIKSLEADSKDLEAIVSSLEHPPADILWEVTPYQQSEPILNRMRSDGDSSWDVFVSHAFEDKDLFARPLAEALRAEGIKVWFDEFELKVGDSLRRSIDKGLSRARYGIVVLSASFFAKEWPQKELDGLMAKESNGSKVVLPVWYELTKEEVAKFSPMLADKYAANSEKGINHIVQELSRVLKS